MRYIWFPILVIYASIAYAAQVDDDTLAPVNVPAQMTASRDSVKPEKQNIIQKVIKYFDNANKPPSDKKIDFSIIGGPAYSNDTELSIGILGAALYTSGGKDSTTSQSNASLYTNFSITGYYNVGVRGVHFTPDDKWRFTYKVSFSSMPTYFWGIGYDNAKNDANKTKFLQLNSEVRAVFDYRLFENWFAGPAIDFDYTKAADADDYMLWGSQNRRTLCYGVGFNLDYDTRDCLTAPHCGWFIGAEQRFYPRFLFNKNAFSTSDITISHYFGAWRDAVMAVNLHGLFTYGDTPWSMLASVGGSHTMRGYYEGRYRDKNAIDLTFEIRQHIWHRNSAVVWAGAGSVFSGFKELRPRKILPNFGVGYRWEFKKNVNVRLDFGIGKGESGVVFNINEAF